MRKREGGYKERKISKACLKVKRIEKKSEREKRVRKKERRVFGWKI